jgi:hypothetical protein
MFDDRHSVLKEPSSGGGLSALSQVVKPVYISDKFDSATTSILKLWRVGATTLRFKIKHRFRKTPHNDALDVLAASDFTSANHFNGAFKIPVALQLWFHSFSKNMKSGFGGIAST